MSSRIMLVRSYRMSVSRFTLDAKMFPLIPIADDFDPVKEARTARKARVSQNEQRQLKNLAHSKAKSTDERSQKKADLDRSLATTRVSTASMGK
jgi:hypothetical protein